MNKNNVIPKWLTAILMVLCAGGMVYCIWSIAKNLATPLVIANYAVGLLTLLADLIYCLNGYKKDASIYYKTVCVLMAVSSILTLILISQAKEDALVWQICRISYLILIVIRLVFAFAKDMGVEATMAFYITMVIIVLLNAGMSIGLKVYTAMDTIIAITVTAVFGIMIYAKYKDKASRGSK